jgi:hypothetical protein
MTTLHNGQAPGVATPNEKAVMGACNTQTASETTANDVIFAPAQEANKTDIATQINAAHQQAIAHADKAIDFAKEAGVLLLDVKAGLSHGEFLPWVRNNLDVTPRQAQRYIATTQGKPKSPSAIKNDTVSHLPQAQPAQANIEQLEDQHSILIKDVASLSETAQRKFERLWQKATTVLQESFRAEVRKEFERTLPDRLADLERQEKNRTSEIRKYQMMRDGIGQFWTEDEYRLVLGVCHPDRESPKERKEKAFILLRKLDSYFSTLKAKSGLKI